MGTYFRGAVLSKLLERLGVAVEVVENGAAAVERVRERSFDCVLMDYQMPDMDGVQTTAAIRALDRDYVKSLPIIAATANAMPEQRAELLARGMDEVVIKPIKPEALQAVLQRWCLSGAANGEQAP